MAAPELRLNVSLDLGFFRQQLQKLTVVAQSEFTPKLNVKFNKQTLDRELNNLQSAIKRRVYRVEIGGNIDAFPEKIKSIRQQLASLETQNKIEVPVSVRNGVTKKDATSVIAAAYKTIRTSGLENTGGKIRIPVSIRPAITKTDVSAFKKAVKESLGGISIDVKANVKGGGFAGSAQGAAGLMEYMRTQGMVGKTASGMEMRMGNEGGKIQRSALDQLARAIFFMAGIDPARVRAEQAERRRIPDINWQAITPPRAPFTGPSSTGRTLPPGIIPASLPGTAFASQKRLVGDILSPSLKDAVRGAANTFVDSIRQGLNDAVRSVRVRDLGNALRPALTGSRVAGLLPPGVGRVSNSYGTGRLGRDGETRTELFARREREARMRSALRGVDVMGEGGMAGRTASPYSYAHRAARPQGAIVPYAPGGAMVYSGPSGGGGTGGGSGNFAGRSGMPGGSFNVPNLPGAGLVREIGTEFAFAAKQVLLFGTAYKALAFIQGFPTQVGDAVGALQSFRNTLNAISPTAQEAAASSEFILNIVDKYNVPLQSARDGFTKLYASMAPTGFSGNEIRDLFTGISQAAATFGMSSDKVDRVTYAFAQMASKGQVMSEELKGQLGDVLPGAMGIFAKAAGFEGEDAIQKFGKALEDGAYKGKPMRDLLKNVTIELKKEFGPGAEGAARTYQGVMTRMANSTKLLYESFEPVAINFLNAIVVPITGGLKTVTDGFNSFFTGQAAQTAGGSAFAKQLETLRPTFEGIAANIKQILPLLQSFASTALSLGQVLLQIAGNPFVGYLARIYLSVLPVTMALRALNLQALIPLIASFLRAIPAFITFQGAMMSGVGANRALIATMQLTGQTAGVTAGKIRLVSAALATLGATAILAGIGLLIERFLMMKSAIDGVRQSTQQMLGSISGMANSGAVKELKNVGKDLQKQRETFEELKPFVSGGAMGAPQQRLTEDAAKKFEELGMGSFVGRGVTGPYITDFLRASKIIEERLKEINKQSSGVAEKMPLAIKVASDLAKQAGTAQAAGVETGGAESAKKQSLESYYSLQDQLAKAQTQADIDRIQALFDHRRSLINSVYDLEEARANSMQKEAIAHQRAISDIFLDRQKKEIDARLEVMKAEGSVAGKTSSAEAGGKSLANGIAQYITGDPSSPFYAADHGGGNYHEHLAFVSRQAAEEAYNKLTSAGIQVTEFKGKGPVGRHTSGSAHYKGLAFDVPGAQVPVGQEKELTARVQSILGISGKGAGAPAKVTGDQKRDALATQSAVIAKQKESIDLTYSEIEAQQALIVQTEKYLAQIFGVAEKELQTSMLQKKTAMLRAGATDQEIEDAMSLEELNLKYAEGIKAANNQIAFNNKLKEKGIISQDQLNRMNAYQNTLIEQLNEELPKATAAQKSLNKAKAEFVFAGHIQALKEEIRLLRIINDEERRIEEIMKERGVDRAKAEEIFDLEKIKQNIQDTRALIADFVTSTSSDYKGFLKAVISGEDAADALKQFQEGLKDRVLTIFLDFAMAPVEKFMKEAFEGLFGLDKASEKEKMPEFSKADSEDPVTATNDNTNATNTNTEAINNLTNTLSTAGTGSTEQSASSLNAAMQSIGGVAFDTNVGATPMQGFDAASVFGNPEALKGSFASLQESLSQSMGGISSSFSNATSSIAETLPSWNDALTTKLPESLTKATDSTNQQIPNFQESLGKVAQGIGIAAGTIMGIAAGISQIKKGGTGNVLMGIGSIMTSIGGGIGGFLNLGKAANGAVWKGGFQAFANGGMVSTPTLGLVGEGKYNEAIVPLPDGRSIPVQMKGESIRDKMGGGAAGAMASPMLSMSFQSTTINGVEYVDRAQLEAAMAETRRMASREGAARGANLALDKLANSPSSRRRVGIR